MLTIIKLWVQRYFSDPEAIALMVLLLFCTGIIVSFGNVLAPFLASIVIAYLLEWFVECLEDYGMPRLPAVCLVFFSACGLFLLLALFVVPASWRQLANLRDELPILLQKSQSAFLSLTDKVPGYASNTQMQAFVDSMLQDFRMWGKAAIGASLSFIPSMFAGVVYLVLVPFLIFFF